MKTTIIVSSVDQQEGLGSAAVTIAADIWVQVNGPPIQVLSTCFCCDQMSASSGCEEGFSTSRGPLNVIFLTLFLPGHKFSALPCLLFL